MNNYFPYILWLAGLVLIYLEFYIPGAVMGIAGGVLVFSSVIIFAKDSGSAIASVVYLLAVLGSVGFLIRIALWRIPSAKPDYSIYSDSSQTGYTASKYDAAAIGKEGTVLSDLKPGGYILVDGKQQQAISQEGYITRGEKVLVVGGTEESLIVKSIKKEKHS